MEKRKKTVSLGTDKDQELIVRLEKYQSENKIKDFTETVRRLLNLALKYSDIQKEN